MKINLNLCCKCKDPEEELDYIFTNFINLVKKNVERRKSKNTTLRIFMYMVKYT
jgi:hypothetical protein